MSQQSFRFTLVMLAVSANFLSATVHAGLFDSWNPFKAKVEADPNQRYLLTEENGPWMILATTFAGDGAEEEAHNLVIDLRRSLNLPAYLHRKRFDYSKPVVGLGVNRFGDPRKMRHRTGVAFDEWAVLIGDFEAMDLPEVKRTLKTVKYTRPESLQQTRTQRLRELRDRQRRVNGDPAKRDKGPMGNAFVTRNPLLPAEYFAPKGMDKFIYNLNRTLDHTLLDCPGKYSVRIATFRGNIIIDQKKIQQISKGAEMGSRLERAAKKADVLTKALRERNVEAYQFHERTVSIVTVGSFDSIGTPTQDGKVIYTQGILRLVQEYGPQTVDVAGAPALKPKQLMGIPFDLQPTAVQVPKYSLSQDYAQSGGWFR